MDKAIVLIDGGYLSALTKHHLPKSNGKPRRLDYGELSQEIALRCGADLLRTYYYDAPTYQSPEPTQEEKERQKKFDRFIHSLNRLEKFEIRLGQLRKYYDEQGRPDFEQKGVDVLLAIDALRLSLKGKITKMILVSGDSDFVPVVKTVKDEGVEVYLFYHESSVHRELLMTCDNRIAIDEALLKGVER